MLRTWRDMTTSCRDIKPYISNPVDSIFVDPVIGQVGFVQNVAYTQVEQDRPKSEAEQEGALALATESVSGSALGGLARCLDSAHTTTELLTSSPSA